MSQLDTLKFLHEYWILKGEHCIVYYDELEQKFHVCSDLVREY